MNWNELDGQPLCAEIGGDEWFGKDDDTPWSRNPKKAKALCAQCEIRIPCLEWALEMEEPYGIWGGLTERERRRLIKQRRVA